MSLGAVSYDDYTVPELKEMADERGIEYTSAIRKAELIDKLEGD